MRRFAGLLLSSLLFAMALDAARPPAKKCDALVVGGHVVTMDAANSVIPDGAIAIKDGKIVAVGPAAALKKEFQTRKTIGRGRHVVLPGLVNTHTHAAMNLLRGIADDRALMDWLQNYIFPAEAKNVSPEFVRAGTALACLEMIRGGTTTFADMYYYEADVADVTARAGLRGVLGETWIDFPAPGHANLEETKTVTRAFLERFKHHPLIVPAIAPHAPYTCSRETLVEAKKMASEFGVPLIIHISETKDEQKTIDEKYKNSPVRWLDSIGFLGANVVAAHGVWLDSEDMKIMAARKTSLSHNPESNMKLGSGIAPVAEARKAGVVVGLGTDGAAGSNNDLDMFEAMDFAGKLAKAGSLDPTALPARDLLRMATIEGAQALGMADRIGSLEPGKAADLIAVDLMKANVQPVYDLYSALVYASKSGAVSLTMVNGRVLWDGRRVQTLNADLTLRNARKWRDKISSQLNAKKTEAPK